MIIQRIIDLAKRSGKKTEGFTLVELLIVVAIIAILAAIAIPQFSKYRLRAYKSEVDSDAKNAYTAAQSYLTDNAGGTVDGLAALKSGGYRPSPNIAIVGTPTMTLSGGSIEIRSTAGALTTNDNALIIFNGRINLPALP